MVQSIDLSTIQLILLIGGAQGFLFSYLSYRQFPNRRENLFLSLLFFVIAFRLMVYPFIKSDFFYTYTFIPKLSDSLLLSVGPLLYLYISQKLNLTGRIQLNGIKALHFLPLLYFLFASFIIGYEPVIDKSHAVLLLTVIYALVSVIMVWKHTFDLSISKGKSISYKKSLIRFIAPFLLIPILITGLIKYSHPLFGFGAATIPYVIISAIFYRMTFVMMLKGKSYLNEISPKIGVVRFNPTDITGNTKVIELISFMENEKPYLDPELNLSKLAELYGAKKHELSELINKDINIGFNDFINYWRVETAKKYLLDDSLDHLTVIGLGHKSGFKSKSTFFESFKKYTGMTPNAYVGSTRA
ncbi:helix-turn-helix domain-containing protein [Flagellimonas sp. W118]|uniref:helix-turn-helix domain-containing protein n=1 Tax=Flagellimonas sp. W118 TaxID=3410791 RepID=UPI003BF4E1FF